MMIHYDSHIIRPGTTLLDITKYKDWLNYTKSKIDKYQIQETRAELNAKYGTINKQRLLSMQVPRSLKMQIRSDINYGRTTSCICLTDIKREVTREFNIKNLTNAGLKMLEMIVMENIIPNRDFTHFANSELPGNFIMMINTYLKMQNWNVNYDWVGNSLISGLRDSFGLYKKYPTRWLMNDLMNGDITVEENYRKIKEFFEGRKVDLYTSDAGIELDIGEYNDQEIIELKLKLAEILIGLVTLKPGGSLIVKIYTLFEKQTHDLLCILQNSFEVLKIVKPMTSKSSNSELYIVGKNFQRCDWIDNLEKRLFSFSQEGFDIRTTVDLKDIIVDSVNKQVFAIERNLYYYENGFDKNKMDKGRQRHFQEFVKVYGLKRITDHDNI